MIKKINRTAEMLATGKVTELNTAAHVKAMVKLNKEMGEVRRDYNEKNQQSQISAGMTVLNS